MADPVIVSGEFRTTAHPKSVMYETPGILKRLEYAEVDGNAVFEGDIILATAEEAARAQVHETLRSLAQQPLETMGLPKALVDALVEFGKQPLRAVFVTEHRWKDGVIPFVIDPGLPKPERVREAMKHWETETQMRIRFRERQPGDQNFVRFVAGEGCSSAVGCRGGEQRVILGPACTAGNAIHEIGHTVGLWHEQSREDRDQFIEIDLSNVLPGTEHNFRQHVADGDDVGAYDFGSIMHYPLDAFATNPAQATIRPKKPVPAGVEIGQRKALSKGDIAAVKQMYP
jgi:astacin (peptidase family M12A)